jgi:hypothetical protein
MSLIDKTYFKGILKIPTNTYLDAAIAEAITAYEDEILKKLLGYPLWKEFNTAYLASIAQSPVALEQKWLDLKNGAEITFDFYRKSVTTKWEGLTNTLKNSLIANYVFYNYISNDILSKAGSVEFSPKAEMPQVLDPSSCLIPAWNRMIDMYGETPSDYYDFGFPDDIDQYIYFNKLGSAYNFLLTNKTTYTNWDFEPLFRLTFF